MKNRAMHLAGITTLLIYSSSTLAIPININEIKFTMPFPKNGIYVEVDPGYIHYNDNTSLNNGGFALNANAGYLFNKFFALETGYTYLPKSKFNFTNYLGSVSACTSNFALNLFSKGILPISSQFGVFAKAGIIYSHHSQKINATGFLKNVYHNSTFSSINPALGIGAQYYLNPKTSLILQSIVTINGSVDRFDNYYGVFAGINYMFK